MKVFLEEARALREQLIVMRRALHRMPELGETLPKTAAYVLEQLAGMGISAERIGESGVTALIGGKRGGKVFLLRADMDALAMKEQSGLPFSAQGGCAHTCGHDLHTAALLGAAKLLKAHEQELEGTVKLMFQPSEENLKGAAAMLEAGILDNPPVDAGMAMHVFPGSMHAGTVAWRAGPALASSDSFCITVRGKGGHGAIPHNAVDPLGIAAHILIALQEINAREVNPQDPLVLTVCSLQAGEAHNAFPDTAVMQGSIRAFSNENRAHAKKRLVEICEGMSSLFRGSCTVEFIGGTPATLNEPALANELAGYLGEVTERLEELPCQMGSEDFAMVTQRIPAAFFGLGAGGAEELYHQGGSHNPKVIFNEEALVYGSACLANCAFSWLQSHKD